MAPSQLFMQRPRCSLATQRIAVHPQHVLCPVRPIQQQAHRHCTCSAAEADAAASTDAPRLQMEEQPNQLNIPTPLGTSEPPQEEPKKLPANARLSETLAPTSTSITIVGDDTDLNWAVCQTLAKKIGWFPVSTAKILQGMHKTDSIHELIQKQGREAVGKVWLGDPDYCAVEAEAGILRGMKDQFRVCVATIGDGAAADGSTYRNLYGSIIIWLDETDKRHPKPASAARALYELQSEVRVQLQVSKGGFGQKDMSAEEKAQKATSDIIKAMNKLLKEHDYLPQKKRLYVEYGCRGDWPELKPKEWNPVLEGLDRKPVVEQA